MECPVCHKEFTPIRVGQTRCSAACNVKWHNKLRKVHPREQTCLWCGKKIFSNRVKKYCDTKCQFKHYHILTYTPKERPKKIKEPKPVKLCVSCDGVVPKGRVRFCSDECRIKNNNDKWNKLRDRRSKETRTCINCGTVIESPKKKKYCSNKCAEIYYRDNLRDKEKSRQYSKAYKHKRKKTLTYKVRKRISERIRCVLKGERHSITYSGGVITYTEDQIKSHLEKQFQNGMTWENYGTVWHIDHKIPVSAFNLHCEEDIKRCWSLKNLQPMFAEENVKKSDKLSKPFQPMLI